MMVIGVAAEKQQKVVRVMALLWVVGDVCGSDGCYTTAEGGKHDDIAVTVIVLVVARHAIVRMVLLSSNNDG
jgi:hypothetical protein